MQIQTGGTGGLSLETVKLAQQALENDGKIDEEEYKKIRESILEDNQVTDAEATFLASLDDKKIVKEIKEADLSKDVTFNISDTDKKLKIHENKKSRYVDVTKNLKEALEIKKRQKAAQEIDADYNRDYKPTIKEFLPLNLSTKEKRLKALKEMTQIDSNSDTKADLVRCGAATIVAAAIYAEGETGLKKLVDMLLDKDPFYNLYAKDGGEIPKSCRELHTIKQKLQIEHRMTFEDIAKIQESLYNYLKQTQMSDDIINALKSVYNSKDPSSGIEEYKKVSGYILNKTIQKFLSDNPDIAKMFDDNKLRILNIDNDGDGIPNHFVLGIGSTDKGTPECIYDPLPRKKGQIVSGEDVNKYNKTTSTKIYPTE